MSPSATLTNKMTLDNDFAKATRSFVSMVDLLEQQTVRYHDRLAYRFLDETGEEHSLTFGEFDAAARSVAAMLSQELSPGDRAVLVYPAGLDFIVAFFGCLYAGVIAVPATYPKPRRPLPRMTAIAEGSGAKVALTTSGTLKTLDLTQQAEVVQQLNWMATDQLEAAPADWQPHKAQNNDLAILQYTSGSTSDPKGVMISHGNLLANLEAIRVAFSLNEYTSADDTNAGVLWLPAYHDMGLIGGVLTPLYVGGPSVLMPPTTFLQKPLRWLQLIDQYRATISGAPNFAYDLCVNRTTPEEREQLDLSSWRIAFCGAEPINAGSLQTFCDAFESAKFSANSLYPCYGLAEATLMVTGPPADQPPTILSVDSEQLRQGKAILSEDQAASQELVGCGTPPLHHHVVVVDPKTNQPCEQGQVGEVLSQGPSTALGYWQQPEATEKAFHALVEGFEKPFLRTGDLGFFYRDELFVTGRLKDVIIIRGRNYYPQDLEQTAEAAHPDVMPGAAFCVPSIAAEADASQATANEPGEQLVLVHQINRACKADELETATVAIRREVAIEHDLEPAAVVLIRQMSLPLTSSGKVQRSLCRRQFMEGELKVVHEWRTPPRKEVAAVAAPDLTGFSVEDAAEQIQSWIREWLAANADLEADSLDRDTPFADLGLDSLTGVEMVATLEQAFQIKLPAVVVWNYPTLATLSQYLAEQKISPQATAITADSSPAESNDAEVESLLAEIEGLTDEEAAKLLSEGS